MVLRKSRQVRDFDCTANYASPILIAGQAPRLPINQGLLHHNKSTAPGTKAGRCTGLDVTSHSLNAAQALNEAGHNERAVEYYRRVLQALRQDRGPKHPDSLEAAVNLAVALSFMGRHEEAVALHRHAALLFGRA